MRLVVDTNVLVSAMLTPGRSAARLLYEYVLVEESGFVLLLDERIVEEYREVLARPRFRLDAELFGAFIADLELIAVFIDAPAISDSPPPRGTHTTARLRHAVFSVDEGRWFITGAHAPPPRTHRDAPGRTGMHRVEHTA